MLNDVLAWAEHGGKLYVSIIIIHGVLMFMSVHHTCNMKTCSGISIAYTQGHRIMLSVCAWVMSSIISVNEWLVCEAPENSNFLKKKKG